jgi:hypothetical protein
LIRVFRTTSAGDPEICLAADFAAQAIVEMAGPEDAERLEALAKDAALGRRRQFLLPAIAKFRKHQAIPFLQECLSDEKLAIEAAEQLSKLHDVPSRERIEQLTTHSQAWVRRKARRAVARLDKVALCGNKIAR